MQSHLQHAYDQQAIRAAQEKKAARQAVGYQKLYRAIRAGYGQGHGAAYQPWLRVRRKNSSPDSNQVVSWIPLLNRTAHFFSRGEYHTALLLLWLGVRDLREQYPIWPISHLHPLDGAPGADEMQFKFVRGLLGIAQEAGIDHGQEIGSCLPYVASLDFMVTVPGKNCPRLAIFSSKPVQEADEPLTWRTRERLELERRYSEEISASYYVTSSSLVPIDMAGQLECWLDYASLAHMPELAGLADPFSEFLTRHADLPVGDAVTLASHTLSIDPQAGWILLRHCAWTQKVDIDPCEKILTTYPVFPGGRGLKQALQEHLFGEAW